MGKSFRGSEGSLSGRVGLIKSGGRLRAPPITIVSFPLTDHAKRWHPWKAPHFHPEEAPSGTNRGQTLDTEMPWTGCRPRNRPPPQEEGSLGLCADVATSSQCDLGQVLLLWGQGERVMEIMQAPLPASKLRHWKDSAPPAKPPGSPMPSRMGRGCSNSLCTPGRQAGDPTLESQEFTSPWNWNGIGGPVQPSIL